jgi:hypothetical protein
MSEWRYRPVPAGIANTASELLQRDKKTSVFAKSGARAWGSAPHLASQRSWLISATHRTSRAISGACTFLLIRENIDEIWDFELSNFFVMPEAYTCRLELCMGENRRNEALSIPCALCKNFLSRSLAGTRGKIETRANRANRAG